MRRRRGGRAQLRAGVDTALRAGLTIVLVAAAVTHLVRPEVFRPAMPPYLPVQDALIALTGWIELAFAVALWWGSRRRLVGRLLALYFLALLPAHLHVSIHDIEMFGLRNPWLWWRTVGQSVFVAWALLLAGPLGRTPGPGGDRVTE